MQLKNLCSDVPSQWNIFLRFFKQIQYEKS